MKVTEVGASVTIKRDVGYKPYIAYLRKLGTNSGPFGTRDHSTREISLWEKAVTEEGDDPLDCCRQLAEGLISEIESLLDFTPEFSASETDGNGHDPNDTIVLVKATIDNEEVDF